MKPIRIQRKRAKGFKMPENTVSVCRPGKWGNPFVVGKEGPFQRTPIDNQGAVGFFEDMLNDPEMLAATNYPLHDLHELRGKNLACFCPLDEPCHADVLLEYCNS